MSLPHRHSKPGRSGKAAALSPYLSWLSWEHFGWRFSLPLFRGPHSHSAVGRVCCAVAGCAVLWRAACDFGPWFRLRLSLIKMEQYSVPSHSFPSQTSLPPAPTPDHES